MRLFYAAGSRPNSALAHSDIWRINLYRGLVQLGLEVLEFDFDLTPHYQHSSRERRESAEFIRTRRPVLESELLNQLARAHAACPVDVFFSYFYADIVQPSTILRIKDMGITTVNWYCNASYQFDLVRHLAPAFDYCLVPERFRLADYRRAGARPVYCQEAADPSFYRPHDEKLVYDITFVGAAYGDRPDYVRLLLQSDLNTRVWGPGWRDLTPARSTALRLRRGMGRCKRRVLGRELYPSRQPSPPKLPASVCGGILTDGAVVRTFSKSKINLGFSSVGDTARTREPIRQVRLRDFEVPMSGGFYMLEYVDEIEDFFVPGEEIVCFSGEEDLVEKARYYLDHDDERETIRAAGHRRARRDHTWQKRLSNAFAEMDLRASDE